MNETAHKSSIEATIVVFGAQNVTNLTVSAQKFIVLNTFILQHYDYAIEIFFIAFFRERKIFTYFGVKATSLIVHNNHKVLNMSGSSRPLFKQIRK